MMKKAIIDQMMLGIFLFFVLIAIGATVSDNTEARDKYYNLKKITDNAVLTVAKCYVNVEPDIEYCKEIYFDMLPQTKLGNEVKDKVYFDDIVVDLTSKYITITAKIDKYIQETFWYKFIDLATFDLNISSTAIIESKNSNENSSSTYSYGIAPFAMNCTTTSESNLIDELTSILDDVIEEVPSIVKAEDDTTAAGNCEGFEIGSKFNLTYDLVSQWDYDNKNNLYPIVPNSIMIKDKDGNDVEYGQDCTSDYLLSDKFDKEEWANRGFDLKGIDENGDEFWKFNWDDPNCTDIGANLFPDYANNIIPAMTSVSQLDVNFNEDNVSSLISLLGIWQGNDRATMAEQGGEVYKAVENIDVPQALDIVTLDSSGKANGVVRLLISEYSFNNSSKDFTMKVEVVGSEYKTVKLVN